MMTEKSLKHTVAFIGHENVLCVFASSDQIRNQILSFIITLANNSFAALELISFHDLS